MKGVRDVLLAGMIVFCADCQGARADALPSFTFDPGKTADFPAWLQPVGAPVDSQSTLNRTSFDVVPPAEAAAAGGNLLLTVIFQGGGSGSGQFLRIYTQSGGEGSTIAGNLDEGTGLLSSRTLLIPVPASSSPTRIVLQSNASLSPIRRLVWEWAAAQSLPVAKAKQDDESAAMLPGAVRGGTLLSLAEVDGSPQMAPAVKVETHFTRTPLLDLPARFDDGSAAFVAAIDRLPTGARLAGKLLGLPPEGELECRVNGERAGTFSAPPPPLGDGSYLPNPDGGSPLLASWRAGALYLPARLLHSGENTIELVPVGKAATPFALRDLVLECVYEPVQPASSNNP